MSGETFAAIEEELIELFGSGVDRAVDADLFDEFALRAFRFQLGENPVYRAYVERRGVEATRVRSWTNIPPVPARGFKSVSLYAGDPARAEALFRTSGTSSEGAARGCHRIRSLRLYDASLLPNFRAHLRPEETARLLSLIPSPRAIPDSSLSYMAGVVARGFDDDRTHWLVDAEAGLDYAAFEGALAEAEAEGTPVLLLATAFALVHWLDHTRERSLAFELPPGSRLMETGGFKGRSREVDRDELYAGVERSLGIRPECIVNEYGMTELLSQFYEPILRGRRESGAVPERDGPTDGSAASPADGQAARPPHRAPPWVRTRVLDPVRLEPLPPGTPGLLCHFDLANLGSVCHVLTEDLGVALEDGFRIVGRLRGAEPRGCSIAMDDLLSVRQARGRDGRPVSPDPGPGHPAPEASDLGGPESGL